MCILRTHARGNISAGKTKVLGVLHMLHVFRRGQGMNWGSGFAEAKLCASGSEDGNVRLRELL